MKKFKIESDNIIAEQDTLQNLVHLFGDNNPGMTSFLFDHFAFKPIDFTEVKGLMFKLKPFVHFLKFIEVAGWLEHTSDWDPYLEIELLDGTKITTENGSYIIDLYNEDRMMRILDEDEEGNEFFHRISTYKLKTITLYR